MLRLVRFYDGGLTLEYLERQPLTKVARLLREAKRIGREEEEAIRKQKNRR